LASMVMLTLPSTLVLIDERIALIAPISCATSTP